MANAEKHVRRRSAAQALNLILSTAADDSHDELSDGDSRLSSYAPEEQDSSDVDSSDVDENNGMHYNTALKLILTCLYTNAN